MTKKCNNYKSVLQIFNKQCCTFSLLYKYLIRSQLSESLLIQFYCIYILNIINYCHCLNKTINLNIYKIKIHQKIFHGCLLNFLKKFEIYKITLKFEKNNILNLQFLLLLFNSQRFARQLKQIRKYLCNSLFFSQLKLQILDIFSEIFFLIMLKFE